MRFVKGVRVDREEVDHRHHDAPKHAVTPPPLNNVHLVRIANVECQQPPGLKGARQEKQQQLADHDHRHQNARELAKCPECQEFDTELEHDRERKDDQHDRAQKCTEKTPESLQWKYSENTVTDRQR